MTKVIVFDFDEVIVKGSDEVKQSSWQFVFSGYPDTWKIYIEEAQKLQGHGAGGDRFTMMRYVFEKLGIPENDIPALVEKGSEVFDTHVQEGILKIGVERETLQMIERLSKQYILCINTATPLEPFRKTVENLGIATYFEHRVFGRPNTKVENFELIRETFGVEPKDILFIGDSPNDFKAAKTFGCEFVAFATDRDPWKEGDRPEEVIDSLDKLTLNDGDKAGERMV